MTDAVTRRQVLRGAAVLLAGAAVGLRLEGTARPVTAERLVALTDGPAARQVGRAYLQSFADPPSAETLARRLLASVPPAARRAASDESLGRLIAARVADDYRTLRTARVEGWVLSVTEARLCGLAALLSARLP